MFDTHPSLRDRLAALNETGDVSAPVSAGEPASALIADVDQYILPLLEATFGLDALDNLKPIDWSVVGESVFPARWRAIAKQYSKWLGHFTADGIPSGARAFMYMGSGLVGSDEENLTGDERIGRAAFLLAVGISAVMLEQGWKAGMRLGMPVQLRRGSETFEPFIAVRALAAGTTAPDAWKAQCQALGIAGRRLGEPAVGDGTPKIPPTRGTKRELVH